MSCKTILLPLLPDKSAGSEFGRAESARRVLGRIAWKHWAEERRIKQTIYTPLIPAFSLKGEGAEMWNYPWFNSRCSNVYRRKLTKYALKPKAKWAQSYNNRLVHGQSPYQPHRQNPIQMRLTAWLPDPSCHHQPSPTNPVL